MIKKRFIIFMLTAVILTGAFLRLYNLGEKPFTGDEYFDINAIFGYFKTGEWRPWDFNLEKVENDESLSAETIEFRNERSWIYRWQVVQLFRWFPETEAIARLASVFWSLVSIGLVYLAAAYFARNRIIALIAAFLFSINISSILIARTLRMYAMFLPAFLLLSWFIYRFLEEEYRGKNRFFRSIQEKWGVNLFWTLPILATGILSFHLQPIAVSIGPIVAAYCLSEALTTYLRDRKWKTKYFFILVGTLAVGAVVATFFNEIFADYLAFPKSFRKSIVYLGHFSSNYGYLPLAFLAMAGGLFFFRGKSKERNWIAANFGVSTFLAMFAWSLGAFDRYLYFAKPFEIMLVAAGIYQGALWISRIDPEKKKRLFGIALAGLCILVPNLGYFWSQDNLYSKALPKDELDYRSIFRYIAENRKKDDVLVTRNYRSYYFSGQNFRVLNFGGEMNLKNKKLSLDELEKFISENESGWVVIPERDKVFVKKDVLKYIDKNLEPVKNKKIKGDGAVYRWPNIDSQETE